MKRLVSDGVRTYGRLDARPLDVNPLDEFHGLTRRLKWLRLKEWQGWTLVHPEVYSSMILQDAHYLASSEIYVRDKASGVLHEHASNARGSSLGIAGEIWGSRPAMRAKGYRTSWLWGTFGTRAADGTPVGANFVDRPEVDGEPEESCLWLPGVYEELSDVVFEHHPAQNGEYWTVSSFDGRLDVTFTPDGRKDVKHQLVLASIDYFQLYGRYAGTIRSLDGTTYDVDVTGVLESMTMRS
ncbi:DUF2804 domain-containing protein [Nocardioides sp. Kera G14]|uniref:DUF2804 family protein n=1 Tax=Nocardioides sp. Kera G14 TaxID=2884264 RepID=UPI001D107D69|nr:DUF2804 family protein [Nocardioides sp. Kera G14]UDY25088.1 DUF2804 domain-containing protein [Nocardioides sp. Kera G14]